jgi:RNA polymerase sigma-70 factor (ECF subfamily)
MEGLICESAAGCSDQTAESLLAAKRHREAFEVLVAQYQEKVFRLAWTMMQNETAAQDMTQEVLLRVWKALPNYQGNSSLSTWIYTITRNTCLTEISRRAKRHWVSLDDPEAGALAEQIQIQDAPDSSAGQGLDIQAMLRRLPEKFRQVITLYYLEEQSYEEVAARLGIPIGTVKTYLHRAKKQLRAFSRAQDADKSKLRIYAYELCNI